MLDFLELEETVGRAWHRLVGTTSSYPVHPDHAVALADVQAQIAVMFRALGGESGVQMAGAKARKSGHRLGWRQRIGLGDECLDQAGRDGATVFLPETIALLPDRPLNTQLYQWLAAWFATMPVAPIGDADPLRPEIFIYADGDFFGSVLGEQHVIFAFNRRCMCRDHLELRIREPGE